MQIPKSGPLLSLAILPNGLNMVRLALDKATFQTVFNYVWITNYHVLTQLPNALYLLLASVLFILYEVLLIFPK